MNNNVIASAIIAAAIVGAAFLVGQHVEKYNRSRAVEVCYGTSTLPYTSETGDGMYFDSEKFKACMNNMGY